MNISCNKYCDPEEYKLMIAGQERNLSYGVYVQIADM